MCKNHKTLVVFFRRLFKCVKQKTHAHVARFRYYLDIGILLLISSVRRCENEMSKNYIVRLKKLKQRRNESP